jgi:hypothetical protein
MRVNVCHFLGLTLLAACPLVAPVSAAESKWVRTGVTGRLIYTPDAQGDRIMDFSDVGYMGRGSELIPDYVPNVVTVSPIAGDDTANIQAAINYASGLPLQSDGFRGSVLLSAGDYDIASQLNITASGVVLRGVGRDAGQTVLHARGTTQRSLVNVVGGGSQSLFGSKRNMIDKVVPVGATSFRVDSTAGLSVNGTVRIERPSTANWIHDLGMDNPPDNSPAWVAGTMNIRYDRTITRIEGNRIFLDAPLANAFELQYGGGTIQSYTWADRIQNVGIENLRAESDFVSDTDDNHALNFVSAENAQNIWVRHTTSRFFRKSAVVNNPTGKWLTVEDAINLDPKSTVTGERRYTFDLSGQLDFVTNSQANSGRHDFVNNSTRPPGPHVFHNSVANNALNDSGPHQRWATGSLFDNITVQGNNIDARNRGSLGTTHGWSGANMVIWNSTAAGFIVQNPPTAQNWLIGSIGTVINDTEFGPQPAGYVDSHESPVTVGGTNSLYDTQMNDSADIREFHWGSGSGNWTDELGWHEGVKPGVYRVSSRDYLVGDIDNFTNDGAGSVDAAYIDPAWTATIQGTSALPIAGLDDLGGNKNVAFTVQHQLDTGERVVHGYLALGLKQSSGDTSTDFVRLFDTNTNHKLNFADMGWSSQISTSGTFVGVIDMGAYRDKLQSGLVNVQINNDTGADWAMYVATVATPIADAIGPSVFIDGAGTATVDSAISPLGSLQIGGVSSGTLRLQAPASISIANDFDQLANGTLAVVVSASTPTAALLNVSGSADLAGMLAVEVAAGFTPAVNTTYRILSAAAGVHNDFDILSLPELQYGTAWQLSYNATSVDLKVIASFIVGDYDHNGEVDAADYVIYRHSLGQTGSGLAADGNGNQQIDPGDYDVWRSHFGDVARNAASIVYVRSVPEPSPILLIATAIFTAVISASRNRRPKFCRS